MIRPFLFLVCLTHPLAAQEVDCANAVAQQDLNQCAYEDWEVVDAELNDIYAEAMALLEGWDADLPKDEQGGARALRDAQRAWITFRDKACEAEGYAIKGGSAEPLLVYGCMRQLTQDRSAQLVAMLDAYR
jgi:uncharacterized protein YecT (DUF1311 family)